MSGSGDRTVRLWDAASGKQIADPLTGHKLEVRCVTFSPDGKSIASGDADNDVRFWDTFTEK